MLGVSEADVFPCIFSNRQLASSFGGASWEVGSDPGAMWNEGVQRRIPQ